jgi:uncharacterized OB-fold protein
MSVEPGMLLPALDDDSAPFWEACGRGELRVQRCVHCARWRFPPRPMCPACRRFDHEWVRMSGLGTVWSFVIPHPPLLPAYSSQAPYNVIVVTLDEDPAIRLVGNLLPDAGAPLNAIDPHTVEIGARVEVVFDPVPPELLAESDPAIALPRWRPTSRNR